MRDTIHNSKLIDRLFNVKRNDEKELRLDHVLEYLIRHKTRRATMQSWKLQGVYCIFPETDFGFLIMAR